MLDKDKIILRDILNKALNDSFRKMLEEKKKLGQSIVTTDWEGNPIEVSAEEAEMMVEKRKLWSEKRKF